MEEGEADKLSQTMFFTRKRIYVYFDNELLLTQNLGVDRLQLQGIPSKKCLRKNAVAASYSQVQDFYIMHDDK